MDDFRLAGYIEEVCSRQQVATRVEIVGTDDVTQRRIRIRREAHLIRCHPHVEILVLVGRAEAENPPGQSTGLQNPSEP